MKPYNYLNFSTWKFPLNGKRIRATEKQYKRQKNKLKIQVDEEKGPLCDRYESERHDEKHMGQRLYFLHLYLF